METDADTIETDRLVLRRWRESDAARLYDIQSRVDVVQWISDDFDNPRLLTDVDDARGRISRYQETFAHPPQGIWAIVPRDAADVPAGAILLKTLPNAEHGEVEIGWWLHPDSHGRGYATEGAGAVLDHAFAGGLTEVWARDVPRQRAVPGCDVPARDDRPGRARALVPGRVPGHADHRRGVVPGSTLRELRGRPPGRLQQFP